MAGESKGNALLRWAVLGESGVIRSFDKVEGRLRQFLSKTRFEGFHQNWNRLLQKFSQTSNLIGQKLGGAESTLGRFFGTLGQKVGGAVPPLAFLGKTFGIISIASLSLLTILNKIFLSLLKLGLIIKGLPLAGLGFVIKQVVSANEAFIESMQELNAVLGERMGLKIYDIVKRERRQLKISSSELLEYITIMMGTQLREQVTKGGELNEALIRQMMHFAVRMRVLTPRFASPIQLRKNIEGIFAGGQEALENFKELFFNVPWETISKRIGVKVPVIQQTLMRGGLSAWGLTVRAAEAFVPMRAIEASRLIDQFRILRETINDFLRESTQTGFFANIINNLKAFNAELIRILESDVGKKLGMQLDLLLDGLREKVKRLIETILSRIDWGRSPKENIKAVLKELQPIITEALITAIKESIVFLVNVGIPILIKAIGEAIKELLKQALSGLVKKVPGFLPVPLPGQTWSELQISKFKGQFEFLPPAPIKLNVDLFQNNKRIDTQTVPIFCRFMLRGSEFYM